jgi:diamine N-acetyltransferase
MRVFPDIRQATLADAASLTELAARTFYDAFAELNKPENMEVYMREAFTVPQLTAELRDPHASFLLAEVEGAPAGYAKLQNGAAPACITGPKPIELVRLYVAQQYHGAGIGNDLMRACLDEARSRGYQTIYLGVWEHNTRAQTFYFKWDFTVVGSHIFQMGDDPQTDWWMQRAL